MSVTDTATARLLDEVQAAGKLPTPPVVLMRLLELTRSSEASSRQLADTIAMDPALSAKILRFVNSPLAGLRSKVSSLPQAVALMGVRSVKMMALSFSAVARDGRAFCKGFDHERYALESLGCAIAARRLSEQTQIGAAQETFLAGLLSQIGRSILAGAFPERYAEVLASAEGNVPAALPPLEVAEFGESYAALGGQVLRAWGLPDELCQAVEVFRTEDEAVSKSGLARILRAAELAAATLCRTTKADLEELGAYVQICERDFQFTRERCAEILNETAKELELARAMFEIPQGKLRPAGELESEIRERIAELSIAMHLENQTMAVQQAELLQRATTDGLTGVGNRAAFDARLSLEMERAARGQALVGLMMIDVDRFKSVNDTYGHLAGDEVLRTIAKVLDGNVRKVDYCARYGGEEFSVIAPATPIEGLQLLAERLRKGVETCPVVCDGQTINVTISIGAALVEAVREPEEAARELVKTADRFLYEAKIGGRNRVVSGRWDAAPASPARS